MPMALILVVDDDLPVRRFVGITLAANGHEVIEAENLAQASPFRRPGTADLMIIGGVYDGAARSQAIRLAVEWGVRAIILLRSSPGDAEDQSEPGVQVSSIRPFSIRGLMEKVRADLRLDSKDRFEDVLQFADVRMDFGRRVITKNDKEVRLSGKEYDLLLCLAVRYDRVVPEQWILRAVWGPDWADRPHRLRFYIRQLREKLEDHPLCPCMVLTVRGVGYRLCAKAFGG
jgi:two-component system KDP operon response regulator KdpE